MPRVAGIVSKSTAAVSSSTAFSTAPASPKGTSTKPGAKGSKGFLYFSSPAARANPVCPW